MAINLNADKYGAQFQEFVNLATRNAGAGKIRPIYGQLKNTVQAGEI